jgi:hypothetical protein
MNEVYLAYMMGMKNSALKNLHTSNIRIRISEKVVEMDPIAFDIHT